MKKYDLTDYFKNEKTQNFLKLLYNYYNLTEYSEIKEFKNNIKIEVSIHGVYYIENCSSVLFEINITNINTDDFDSAIIHVNIVSYDKEDFSIEIGIEKGFEEDEEEMPMSISWIKLFLNCLINNKHDLNLNNSEFKKTYVELIKNCIDKKFDIVKDIIKLIKMNPSFYTLNDFIPEIKKAFPTLDKSEEYGLFEKKIYNFLEYKRIFKN